MIVIQHQPKRVEVNVYGEFTLADYKEFEDMVNYTVSYTHLDVYKRQPLSLTASAMPSAAEIEVDECPTPNVS